MNTKIEYKNSRGVIIKEEEKYNLWEHFKLEYDVNTGKLKIKTHYLGEDINTGYYFMDSSENLNDVISKIDHSHRWLIYNDLEIINKYNIWRENYYHYEELSDSYNKVVLKTNGEQIAKMNFETNGQIATHCSKIFDLSYKNMICDGKIEGSFLKGDYVYFGHSNNGSFHAWSNTDLLDGYEPLEEINLEQFIEVSEGNYIFNLMTQEMRDYFLNLQPLVPTFEL